MPFDVRVEAHVATSPEDVAAYMFNPKHDPDWITGIERVDLPATPVGVGTETYRIARSMGRRIDYVLRVMDYVPDRLLVMSRYGHRFRWASPMASNRTQPDLASACE
jgi:hypothetical protein